MNFIKLSSSLLTASTLLASVLPAYAGPFDLKASPIFANPAKIGPVVNPAVTPGSVSSPADAATKPADGTAGSEVNALGTHNSWVDPKNLAKDPRALCSDVGLGNNTHSSAIKIASTSSTKETSSSASSKNDGGGGGFSFLGIGASGSGSTQGSNNQSQSKALQSSQSDTKTNSSSTVAVGRNCDAFVQSAAARDMNYEDNVTKRYEIKTGRRGQQVDNLLDTKK